MIPYSLICADQVSANMNASNSYGPMLRLTTRIVLYIASCPLYYAIRLINMYFIHLIKMLVLFLHSADEYSALYHELNTRTLQKRKSAAHVHASHSDIF